MDVALALIALALTAPLFALIALSIRLDSAGPVLFRQRRVGKSGRIFVLLKFRTMDIDAPNVATDELQRLGINPITRVGAFLRRTSLDELPQLINVLRGEMSLVGPRPALPSQTELNRRRAVRGVDALLPGITGWAQINGRDDLSLEAKVAHDAWYRRRRSIALDLVILARTFVPVLSGRGNR